MFDQDYYLDEDTRFYKEQEELYYRQQRQEAKRKKVHTFEESLFIFEDALFQRCITSYSDYDQPYTTHKRNQDLIELVNEMRKKHPKEKRFSYQYLQEWWNSFLRFREYNKSDWFHHKDNGQWVTGPGTIYMEEFIDKTLLPYIEKTKKYKDRAKSTFTIEAPKTMVIEPKKEEPITEIVIEEPKVKGRPKGSKNKKETPMKPPTHNVTDTTIIAALQDIIWYQSGMKANEIMNYINADDSITKKIYGKLHEYNGKLWEKRIVGKLFNGKNIERFYPLTPRKGYFYNGEILSLSKLALTTGMAKQTLSYRISKGQNHIDAIETEINNNMKRK